MSLPEIPDDVRHAIWANGWWGNADELNNNLQAAWPHLYAAALRHAAEVVDEDAPFEGVRGQRVVRQSSSKLRRLADEATP